MTPTLLGRALVACLGLGAVDVLALNLLAGSKKSAADASRGAANLPLDIPRGTRTEQVSIAPASPLLMLRPAPDLLPPAAARHSAKPLLVLEFGTSAHWLDGRAQQTLSSALEQLRSAPQITVVGHADGSGPIELNERLSAVRAAVVARRLRESGISGPRVHVDWRGAREPSRSGESKRVEIYLEEAP